MTQTLQEPHEELDTTPDCPLASLFNLVWLTSRWRMSPKDVETSTPPTSLDLTVQRGQRTLTRSRKAKASAPAGVAEEDDALSYFAKLAEED